MSLKLGGGGGAVALLLLAAPLAPAQDRHAVVLTGLSARCIGPANMGGRVVDLAVVERNPATYYVAAGSGGVWKTSDAGATFTPIFDAQPTLSIGAVAVCQGKPDVLYVGTGEGNPRNSVSRGSGVYRSTDAGKTWTHCGLADTHHIGRVAVHPKNADVAYVAALGHVWGPNPERGLYKTADGGKSWKRVKFIDEHTGFIDVQLDPADPDTLYAAAWPVRRDAFAGGSPLHQTGPTGGLFQSNDGGKTWERLAGGLPTNVGYGRCGIAVSRKNPDVLYAVVQTSETAGAMTNAGQPATPRTKTGAPGTPGKPETGGVFRSADKGQTWTKVNDLVPRPFYYGQIRIDPSDDQRVYVLGITLATSADGGRSFTAIGRTIHPDHHALWIDPRDGQHIIVGNDGGVYSSKSRGQTFTAHRGLVLSQFYGVSVDTRTPYRVYGGLQDNGTWGGPTATRYTDGITLADWHRLLGYDGFQTAVDPTDPRTVYAESQYGALVRIGLRGGPTVMPIRPPAPKAGPAVRYNWNTPLLLSPHDPKTLYYGGQYVFKSANRGDTWQRISSDLTAPPKDAAVLSGHTILSLAESPVKAGVLWAGTDDGKLCVSRTDGRGWADMSTNLPGPPTRAVAKIECSHFAPGTAFVAIDRHRRDDFAPYLFRTADYGATWNSVAGDLPAGAVVGVVRQSSKNKHLLFAGTDIGLFVTLDSGVKWHRLAKCGLPAAVRVDDLVIHPRDRELVIGTHGRGIWIMDIAPLEQLSGAVWEADAHLFDVKPTFVLKPQKRGTPAPPGYKAANPPAGIAVHFLTTAQTAGKLELTCANAAGRRVGLYLGRATPGLDSCVFDVQEPGEYTITLKAGEVMQSKRATVKELELEKAE